MSLEFFELAMSAGANAEEFECPVCSETVLLERNANECEECGAMYNAYGQRIHQGDEELDISDPLYGEGYDPSDPDTYDDGMW